MLRLIEGKKNKRIDYTNIYIKAFQKNLIMYEVGKENKDILRKMSFYGVKIINQIYDKQQITGYEELLKILEFAEVVKIAISLLTPNELITVFPIEKRYDGEKYQIKDYYFTLEKLQQIGMDNIIRDRIDELLWDYQNKDIMDFQLNSINIISHLYKYETGESLAEKWAKENNIQTYQRYDSDLINKKYIYDARSAKSIKIKQKNPKYLKALKGGRANANKKTNSNISRFTRNNNST